MRCILPSFAATVVAAATVAPALAVAQDRPDYSGKWIFVADKSVTDAQVGNNGIRSNAPYGLAFTVTQTPLTLTIEVTQSATAGATPPAASTYTFNGAEKKSMLAAAGSRSETQRVAKADWNGKQIVITTDDAFTIRGGAHTSKAIRSWSIAADGTLVVITKSWLDGIPAPDLRAVYKKG